MPHFALGCIPLKLGKFAVSNVHQGLKINLLLDYFPLGIIS
jgi:hypothetical protein